MLSNEEALAAMANILHTSTNNRQTSFNISDNNANILSGLLRGENNCSENSLEARKDAKILENGQAISEHGPEISSNCSLLNGGFPPGAEAMTYYMALLVAQQQQQQQQLQAAMEAQRQQHARQIRQQFQQQEKKKPGNFQFCKECKKDVHSSKLPCHIRQYHIKEPMFLCPKCDFVSTYSKNNVKSHMVSLHGLAGDPISYMEYYAPDVERLMKICFPKVRGRGRPNHSIGRPRGSPPASPSSTRSIESRGTSTDSVPADSSEQMENVSSGRKRTQTPSKCDGDADDKRSKEGIISSTDVNQSPGPAINAVKQETQSATADIHEGSAITLECTEDVENLSSNDEKSGTVESFSPPTGSEEQNYNLICEAMDNDDDNSDINIRNEEKLRRISGASLVQRRCKKLQPRYIANVPNGVLLSTDDVSDTAFATFNEANMKPSRPLGMAASSVNFSSRFQNEQIEKVRKEVGLTTSSIAAAICGFNLTELPVEQVDMIMSVAPSTFDSTLLRNMRNVTLPESYSDNALFIMQLAQIDRLEEKLHVMSYMGHFDSQVGDLKRQMHDLTNAATMLRFSPEFHSLLHLVLVHVNSVLNPFDSDCVGGFRTSCLADICSFQVPNSPGTTMLTQIASMVSDNFPAVVRFRDQLPILDKASKTSLKHVSISARRLERGYERFCLEVHNHTCSSENFFNSRSIKHVKDFIQYAHATLRDLSLVASGCKMQLISMLRYFGETFDDEDDDEVIDPAIFFARIASFYRSLQKAFLDLHL